MYRKNKANNTVVAITKKIYSDKGRHTIFSVFTFLLVWSTKNVEAWQL